MKRLFNDYFHSCVWKAYQKVVVMGLKVGYYKKAPLVFLSVLLLFLSPLLVWKVSANWYSYYSSESGHYGIWATIYTPSSKPYTPSNDHQSHSVTTPGGGPWVQAGWIYYPNWSQPKRYYEYGVGGLHDVVESDNQPWGTGIKYEVSQDGPIGLNRWCIWINHVKKDCFDGIHTAPSMLIAQSETHETTDTMFFTTFDANRVRNGSGVWIYPPELWDDMKADPPYGNSVLTDDRFITWRHAEFLPSVTK